MQNGIEHAEQAVLEKLARCQQHGLVDEHESYAAILELHRVFCRYSPADPAEYCASLLALSEYKFALYVKAMADNHKQRNRKLMRIRLSKRKCKQLLRREAK